MCLSTQYNNLVILKIFEVKQTVYNIHCVFLMRVAWFNTKHNTIVELVCVFFFFVLIWQLWIYEAAEVQMQNLQTHCNKLWWWNKDFICYSVFISWKPLIHMHRSMTNETREMDDKLSILSIHSFLTREMFCSSSDLKKAVKPAGFTVSQDCPDKNWEALRPHREPQSHRGQRGGEHRRRSHIKKSLGH